jgi:hypothetical protein
MTEGEGSQKTHKENTKRQSALFVLFVCLVLFVFLPPPADMSALSAFREEPRDLAMAHSVETNVV